MAEAILASLLLAGIDVAQRPSLIGSNGLIEDLEHLGPGQVWLVPSGSSTRINQPSIQAAVDAASEGDTVLLSDGVFRGPGNRDILVRGKNLVVRSENGPERCVIDCQRLGGGFEFLGEEVTGATLLYGVAIVNGRHALGLGGGVFINTSNSIPWSTPTIESCVFRGCDSGAIFYEVSRLTPRGIIRNCVLTGNSGGEGGAIKCYQVDVEGCIITDNFASGGGWRDRHRRRQPAQLLDRSELGPQ